jgi:hypothetical protein
MQRRSKQAFPAIDRLCFLRGPLKVVIKKSSVEKNWVQFRDASLPGWVLEQLDIELRESAVEGDWEEMARRELGCEKETSYVIWNDSEPVINPLPGYD